MAYCWDWHVLAGAVAALFDCCYDDGVFVVLLFSLVLFVFMADC